MKHLSLFTFVLLLALAVGCSPVITGAEVSTVAPDDPGQPVVVEETAAPATPTALVPTTAAPEDPAPGDLRPIPVDNVGILTGWASPIPALVAISGSWPDLCAQLAQVSQPVIDDFEISFSLLATPADPACPPDFLGLPFYLEIPLNWGQLPEGVYTVTVNDQQTTLALPVAPPELADGAEPALTPPVTPTPGGVNVPPAAWPGVSGTADLAPITVDAAVIEVGIGSPIPVELHVAAGWPSLCAQLAEIRQEVGDFQMNFTVLAHPGAADCPPDYVGYGFGLNLPINVVELPEGTYTVTVNGATTTLQVPVTPPAAGDPPPVAVSTGLCPEVARPAVAVFLPGVGYQLVDPSSGASCQTTLDGDVPGLFQAVGDAAYYTVLTGAEQGGAAAADGQFALKRVATDGTATLLPYTAVAWADAQLAHRFVVAANQGGIAWSAAHMATDGTDVAVSNLWVADAASGDVWAPLPPLRAARETGAALVRALAPVRFSQDGAILYYTIQPVVTDALWDTYAGRHDNLYALRLRSEAPPELVFDCAAVGVAFCLGDFMEMDGQVTILAYVDANRAVVVRNGEGQTLNTVTVAAGFVGYPTFGPGGDLLFYAADPGDAPTGPASGSIYRVAPPTAPAELLASAAGLGWPQGWLDATRAVLAAAGGAAVVGMDGAVQAIDVAPDASFVAVLP